MNSATVTVTPDRTAISEAVKMMAGGGVVELRIFAPRPRGAGKTTFSGYFDDYQLLAKEAAAKNKDGADCYITINCVDRSALARACNRIKQSDGDLTKDHEITERRWLLIDLDANRLRNISSTDQEHEAAIERGRRIREYLTHDMEWPEPIFADSGNGAHLLFRIGLPNEPNSLDLVKRCLAALGMLFDDDVITVDQAVCNASRISKAYGTVACKGDSIPERPHRLSRILEAPEHEVDVVPIEKLGLLASKAPKDEGPRHHRNGHANGTIDVESYLQEHGVEVLYSGTWNDARKWVLKECPWCESTDKGAVVFQFKSGAVGASCRHNRCCGKGWDDFKDAVDPGWRDRKHERHERTEQPAGEDRPKVPLLPMSIGDLREQHPYLKDAVIDGLLRRQETANVIAASKVGKSWLTYSLALSVATGSQWLDTFRTYAGRVLLIDNELHPETIGHRIPQVAEALAIRPEEYQSRLDILPLRGRLTDIYGLTDLVEDIGQKYHLVIVDAFYRMFPPGVSENDNAAMAAIYNLVDQYATATGAAWLFIHHSTKGSQSEKAVTDVGAGAGSQSRAADAHLVLRPHEEDGVVVLDAAVRSWPPIDPLPLRWTFPVWTPDESVDPEKLKGKQSQQEQRQRSKDLEGIAHIVKVLECGPALASEIREETGLGKYRCDRLLDMLIARKDATYEWVKVRGQNAKKYTLPT